MKRLAVFDSIALRLAMLLAIALLPIGLIAVVQSRHIADVTDRRSEASLLALTSEAAGGEESLIRTGFGAAGAIISTLDLLRAEPGRCDDFFSAFLAQNPDFSFAGYVNSRGRVECASAGQGRDVSNTETFRVQSAMPMLHTTANANAGISGQSVVVLSRPVFKDGTFDGYVALSLPHARIAGISGDPSERPFDIVTFNAEGSVMSAQTGLDGAEAGLPRGIPLVDLAHGRRVAFTGLTRDGREATFAVVPIVPNTIFAIGSWPRERFSFSSSWTVMSPIVLPVLMWLACLGVAYVGVHRLVVKHIHWLKRDMQSFMASRRFGTARRRDFAPSEIREIEETWQDLAETVVREEAELEGSLRDKTVLLKEVHHRVKNNLQLVSSIINMKMRRAVSQQARVALHDVQLRVMAIASVHRSLYENSQEGRVRADQLLSSVVGMTVDAGLDRKENVDLTLNFAPLSLYPDQAVPLSLLAAEAVTNALKYHGRPEGSPKALIAVTLEAAEPGHGRFSVVNSRGERGDQQDEDDGSGLGSSLITAFAHQMRGHASVREEAQRYWLTVDFPIAEFDEDGPDDLRDESTAA